MNTININPSRRGALLGIDHGLKVMGFAVCDASWIVARPLSMFKRTTRAADFAKINELIMQREIKALIVGLPDNPEPERSSVNQATTVRRWSTRLAAAVSVPVYLWEEQYSSLEAERLAAEAELSPTDRIDDRAAAVILQSFIEAHPSGAALPKPVKTKSGLSL